MIRIQLVPVYSLPINIVHYAMQATLFAGHSTPFAVQATHLSVGLAHLDEYVGLAWARLSALDIMWALAQQLLKLRHLLLPNKNSKSIVAAMRVKCNPTVPLELPCVLSTAISIDDLLSTVSL